MKGWIYIFLMLWLFGSGCSDDDQLLSEQQSKYVSYLSSTHVPKLVSEQEKSESQDQNLEYYTPMGESVYRYIRHIYDLEREQYPEIAYGDRVTLTFRMYEFLFSNIVYYGETITGPFYSNDVLIEQALYNSGLTPGAWSFEPLVVELGSTQILKGLEMALPGCRERDTVEVYMTYNMAYGKKPFGNIPGESPVAVFFSVDNVEKN